jgi:hypothetical protein
MSEEPVGSLLRCLVDEQVAVVIVGGFAAVALGVPCVTQDIDLCYDSNRENLARLTQALLPFHPRHRAEGLSDEQARALPFRLEERMLGQVEILTLQTDATELDLMSRIPGIGSYAEVRRASIGLELFGVCLPVLDLPGLIISKRASGRPKDLLALPQIEATLRLREQ